MTEAEWLSATDPHPMLRHLKGTASDRRLRLFACGCGRRLGGLLTADEDVAALRLGEWVADGEPGAGAAEAFRRQLDWTRRGAAKYAVYPHAGMAAVLAYEGASQSLVEAAAAAAVRRALDEEGETVGEALRAGELAYAYLAWFRWRVDAAYFAPDSHLRLPDLEYRAGQEAAVAWQGSAESNRVPVLRVAGG